MTQHPVELILMRELADHLSTPIFVVDAEGGLAFYNEPAEALLGRRFDETGPMPAEEVAVAFSPTDDRGEAITAERLPLMVALRERQPDRAVFAIRALDGVTRRLEVTAVPIIGRTGVLAGAVALFWEVPQ